MNYLSAIFKGEERDYGIQTLALKLSTFPRLFPRIGLPSLAKHTDNVSGAHKALLSVEITASASRSLRKPLSIEGSALDSDTSFQPLLQLPPN